MTDCAREVRRDDHDRYLACLFAPTERREVLFALHAFNLELAKTAEVVSEPMIGQIRLQWWRESLEGIYQDKVRSHYAVGALARAVKAHGLAKDELSMLVDARESDLEDHAPASLVELEGYAARTSGQLAKLSLSVLGAQQTGVLRAGQSLGTAWGLLGLCRAVPFQARQDRTFLPRDLTAGEGLDLPALLQGRSSPALCRVIAAIAERAAELLETASPKNRPNVARKASAPFLLGTLARSHLKTLKAAGHDPFDPRVQLRPPAAVWRLLWARTFGRY